MNPEEAESWTQSAGLSMRYDADLAKLNAAAAPFIQLCLDQGTADYISLSAAARHGRWMTWLHSILRTFLSDFDVNGILGTYPMHVLSEDQWGVLLGDAKTGSLLDIGAGRGDATSHLAAHFDTTTVTETSRSMAKRLRKLGYECIEGDIASTEGHDARYDAVSLLNVLDRCDRPLSLLGAARSVLKPGGLLIIALVLPYRPFVYDQGAARAPHERLPIRSNEWEVAATEFVTTSLLPLGVTVEAISRAPYLSGGDSHRALYELDDVIVICRATGEIQLVG